MSMKNAAQGHTTVEEEDKTIIMKNLQSGGSVLPQDRTIAPRINSLTYYRRRGLKKVQMAVTPTIFLSRKRYGNPRVS
jgi:hypothetical protein